MNFKKFSFYLSFFFLSPLAIFSQNSGNSTAINEIHRLIDKSNTLYYIKTDSALLLAKSAMNYAKKVDYKKGVADALTTIGIAYDIYGDLGESFSAHKKAFDIYDQISDPNGKANSQYNIAMILSQNGKYDESIVYITDSKNYYESSGNRKYQANALSFIAEVLIKKGEDLPAIVKNLEEARFIYREMDNTVGICSSLNLEGDAYLQKNRTNEAIKKYAESAGLLNSLNNPWYLGYSYLGLAKSYLANNELGIARENAQKGIDQYKLIDHKRRISELYQIKTSIAEQQGDLRHALDYFRIHQVYKDSIYNENQSKQINLLNTQFESEKKEAEIASLSQQASIQALEIKQKNQAIIIGIVATLFVLVVVYFLYNQRETTKQQSQTELEQRFLRSQLNPHFISNALVAVQSFMLKNDAETAALYLTKFSKLMREILENSRKEFIPVEEEISMLRNYLYIHKLRLDSFDFNIEIDENIDPEVDTIPPMFVQPFVENAVEHGISNIENGMISLKFMKEEDYISIEVNDNGKGLSPNQKEDHHSLSSTIIKERIDLFNKSLKKKISLTINNINNELNEVSGTRIELKVPFG